MKKMKTMFRWMGGAVLALALACITMPFGMGYPFLYIKYSLDPHGRIPEPSRMEKILQEYPSDLDDLEHRLSEYVKTDPIPRPSEPGFEEFLEQGREEASRYVTSGKLKSVSIHWYHGKRRPDEVAYIVQYRAKSAWDRAKADMGGHIGGTNYDVLFDRDWRILGWLTEEV
ncbi:Hypothetical protein PYTT_1699 [Akkermansia glycaniphila]|uniref:Uncharacterized protein n=2 Tax=Akkermansia glycaniphila TaxID=1679444 RepID=A0A1C7PEJ1_9BACT|nr:hypothetical protein [Akkermansia glycaniphila]OCA03824.1 hypothetical protein AC781_02595 [Akkermansia glycaniphila]SEH91680.1 Hypothetical protein PYTT_1699 [Akkermansia glycaniphila]